MNFVRKLNLVVQRVNLKYNNTNFYSSYWLNTLRVGIVGDSHIVLADTITP